MATADLPLPSWMGSDPLKLPGGGGGSGTSCAVVPFRPQGASGTERQACPCLHSREARSREKRACCDRARRARLHNPLRTGTHREPQDNWASLDDIQEKFQSPPHGDPSRTCDLLEHGIRSVRVSIPSARGPIANLWLYLLLWHAAHVSIPSARGPIANLALSCSSTRSVVSIPSARGPIANPGIGHQANADAAMFQSPPHGDPSRTRRTSAWRRAPSPSFQSPPHGDPSRTLVAAVFGYRVLFQSPPHGDPSRTRPRGGRYRTPPVSIPSARGPIANLAA